MKNYNNEIKNKFMLDSLNLSNELKYIDLILKERVDDATYLNYLSVICKIPVFDYKIKLEKLYNGVSINIMEEHGCLIYENRDCLICLLYNPIIYYNIDFLTLYSNKDIVKYIISEKEWYKYKEIARLSDVEKSFENFSINQVSELKEEVMFHYNEVSSSPIVMMVNHWIEKSIVLGASDIHFEPGKVSGKVRVRLDGKLKVLDSINMDGYDEVITRIKVISGLDISKKMEPQDGKYIMSVNKTYYDLRISSVPTILGEKIVLRILNREALNSDFKKLNYLPEEEELVKDLLKEKSGLILITGPTGSGKTTTLYTYLKELINESNNIITVEDPVEYTIEGINQIQVNNIAGLTFAKSLRSILRQDPNIIMIGEIRDEETAQIACRAAISGHLVLSTLHTNSSIDAITRLLDMGIPRYLVTSALKAVISQRLVRKLCPICKKKMTPTSDVIKKFCLTPGTIIFNKGGCENCYNTGYKGRILLSEILVLDDNLRELIAQSATIRKLENYAKKNNMIFLEEKWFSAIMSGNTTIEERIN